VLIRKVQAGWDFGEPQGKNSEYFPQVVRGTALRLSKVRGLAGRRQPRIGQPLSD
jgi:hypothetical protein